MLGRGGVEGVEMGRIAFLAVFIGRCVAICKPAGGRKGLPGKITVDS